MKIGDIVKIDNTIVDIVAKTRDDYIGISKDNRRIFYFPIHKKEGHHIDKMIIGNNYPYEEYKEPEYIPYTFETMDRDKDIWFKSKFPTAKFKIIFFNQTGVTIFNNVKISYDDFFMTYMKEDGSPAGTLK